MLDVITTMCPQCVLLRFWQLNQSIQYFEITNCVRKTHWERASNKKSIRWIFCLRARVNDASDYQWGVRLSTEKKFAAPPFHFCAPPRIASWGGRGPPASTPLTCSTQLFQLKCIWHEIYYFLKWKNSLSCSVTYFPVSCFCGLFPRYFNLFDM
jgi:hypothetical protein